MHRSFCDCLKIVLDMDNPLQTIKQVFGSIFSKEVDVFCYCASTGLYYEQNKLEKGLRFEYSSAYTWLLEVLYH